MARDPDATIDPETADATIREAGDAPVVSGSKIAAGTRIGRYHVMGPLGAGGMGEVYRAYDPDLDRSVAIKILRHDAFAGHLGLLREAQALARLSHPNVVAVYDVGTIEGGALADPSAPQRVFVAMEYIDGVDLATWLARARGADEIVTVFEAAARGLAAAHAVGIVHRDFKPANVLLGRDGRVRVADFGLARMVTAGADDEPSGGPGVLLQTQLTGTGLVVGTPSYIAPEVQAGGTADMLADQYSYFVALFEALVGRRPFVAHDLAQLLRLKRAGIDRWPDEGDVPPWLRRMVLRGLATDPKDRHPSMVAIIDQIEAERRPKGRRAVALLTGSAVVIAAALWSSTPTETATDRCAHVDALVDGVWGDERRMAVERTASRLGHVVAEPTASPLHAGLTEYLTQWQSVYVEHCRVSPDVGVAPWQQLDPKARCLRHGLFIVDAMTRPLAEASATLADFDGASRAIARLTRASDCGSEAFDSEYIEPPPALLVEVEDARLKLDELEALAAIGRAAEAAALLDALDAELAMVDFEPVRLEAAMWRGNLAEDAGDYALAERILTDTMYRAQAVRSDQLAWRAMYSLLGVIGSRLGRPDEAQRMLRQAASMVDRLNNPKHRVGFFEARSLVAHAQSRLLDAEVDLRTARVLALTAYGEMSVRIAELDVNLANVLLRLSRSPEAVPILERAIPVLEHSFGPDANEVASARALLAGAQFFGGDLDAAELGWTQVLADRERLLGREHPRLLTTLRNLAQIAIARGNVEHAQALLDRAMALGIQREPHGGGITRGTLFVLGRLQLRRGHLKAARATFAGAIASLGDQKDDQVLMSARALAAIERDCGRPARAAELLDLAASVASSAATRLEIEVDRAALEAAMGDRDGGTRRLQVAAATDTEDAGDMRDTIGEVHLALARQALTVGDCARATRELDDARRMDQPGMGATLPSAAMLAWTESLVHACSGDADGRARAEAAVATHIRGVVDHSLRITVALAVADELWTTGEARWAHDVADAAQREATSPGDDEALARWINGHPIDCR